MGPDARGPGRPGVAPDELKGMVVDFVGAVSTGDTSAVEALVGPAFVDHNPVWGTTGLDSMVASYALLRAAMPDLRVEVEAGLVLADGDQAAGHSLVTGAHTGSELFGAPATGEAVTWTHTDVVRVAGGRIVERWASSDTMHLFQWIGVVGH